MSTDTNYVLNELRKHPRVCANCFRFRHAADPIPPLIQEKAKHGVLWAQAVVEPWTRMKDMHTDAPPGEVVSEWAERTVCECGNFSPYASTRETNEPVTIDTETVFEYCDHISATLDELRDENLRRENYGNATRFHHDRSTLFDVAKHLKSQPEWQFRDDDVLTTATELATRRAGTAPGGRDDDGSA